MRYYLVSCAAKKRNAPCPAKDLNVSGWFVKARGFVEKQSPLVHPVCKKWASRSGRHGFSLQENPETDADKLLAVLNPDGHVTILAGDVYRALVVPKLKPYCAGIDIPMADMRLASG